jgi:hypothetical protein
MGRVNPTKFLTSVAVRVPPLSPRPAGFAGWTVCKPLALSRLERGARAHSPPSAPESSLGHISLS